MSVLPTSRLSMALFSAVFFLFGCGASEDGAEAVADELDAPAASETVEMGASAVDSPYERALGDPNAPVTIIEYASITCSHCAAFHAATYPELKSKYVDTGKVRYVFREFRTAPAQLSTAGFVLARCVGDKFGDKGYFAFLDALFRTQSDWISQQAKDELLKLSAAANLSADEFNSCLSNSQDAVAEISAGEDFANEEFAITGTPSFVINGELRKNVRTIEDFDAVLEPLLSE